MGEGDTQWGRSVSRCRRGIGVDNRLPVVTLQERSVRSLHEGDIGGDKKGNQSAEA